MPFGFELILEPTTDQHRINIGPDATETSSVEMVKF